MFKSGNVTVYASDFARTLEYYTKTLGLKKVFDASPHWAEVATESLTIGIHGPDPKAPAPAPGGRLSIGLIVQKIEPAVAQLQERGVSFAGPVVDSDWVKLAHFADPDGNVLYLCEVKPPPAAHAQAHEAAQSAKKAPARKAKAKARK